MDILTELDTLAHCFHMEDEKERLIIVSTAYDEILYLRRQVKEQNAWIPPWAKALIRKMQ